MPSRLVDAEMELNANSGAGKILPVDNVGPNRTFQIAVGDFNGDSFGDVAVGSPSKIQGQTFTAMIYENRLGSRAPAQFGPNRVRYGELWTEWFARREDALLQADATPDQVSCLATGDITGDRVDDLLLVRSGSTFGARNPDPSDFDPERERRDEDTFDVDAKGRLIYPTRSQAMVYAGTRPAGAGPSLSITKMRSQVLEATDTRYPGTRAFDCAVVNLDRDGFSDIIITGYGFGSPHYRPEAHLPPHGSEGWSLTYRMNDSSMTRIFRSFGLDRSDFAGRTLQLSMDEFPRQMMKVYSLGVGDLDGDKTPEIILGTASQLRIFSQ